MKLQRGIQAKTFGILWKVLSWLAVSADANARMADGTGAAGQPQQQTGNRRSNR